MHGDLCKHLGIDGSTDLESIPKCLHKSPCACRLLENDLILRNTRKYHQIDVYIYQCEN